MHPKQIIHWTCEHDRVIGSYGSVSYSVSNPSNYGPSHVSITDTIEHGDPLVDQDWAFALKVLAKECTEPTPGYLTYPDHLRTIELCGECYGLLPSRRNLAPKPQAEPALENEEYQEALERVEAGEAFYFCNGCTEFLEEDELVELRECPHCDEVFDGNEGRNCPSCNRPFTRNLEVMGCSNCLDPDSSPDVVTQEWLQAQLALAPQAQ